MIDQEQKKRLIEALHHLECISNDEDHCDDRECTIDTPKCEIMSAQAAVREINFVLDPPMESLHPERLTCPRERIFVEEWIRENTRGEGMANNNRLLEHILSTKKRRGLGGPEPVLDYVTQREAHVATSVIQWLGTNCGQSFLHEVRRKIDQVHQEDRDVQTMYHRSDYEIRDLFKVLEDRLLDNIIPMPYQAERFTMGKDLAVYLRNEISNVLRVVMSLFALETGKASLEEAANSAGYHPKQFAKVHAKAKQAVDRRVRALRARNLAKPA